MNSGVVILTESPFKRPSPTATGVLRCLKKENIPTLLISSNRHDPAVYSKYVRYYPTLDPKRFPDKYMQTLLDIGRDDKNYVLMPTSDDTLKLVSNYRDLLSEYFILFLPKREVIDVCLNKRKMYEIAIKNDIPVPRTVFFDDVDELRKASKVVRYPCLVKPHTNDERIFFHKKVIQIESPSQLISVFEYLHEKECIPMIQEKIIGPPSNLYSLGTVMDEDHETVAVFTGRKIRQLSYDFGVGTFCESLWVPEVAELGVKLLKSIKYTGIAQVEFKFDPRDRKYKLMEINARPWFWVSLTAACGMNIPYILYKLAIGENACVKGFLENIKWQWTCGDIGLFITQIISKNPDFSFRDFFHSLFEKRVFATYSINDLNPFCTEITQSVLYIKNLLRYFI
jgi:D-aspartate ligase